MKGIIYASITLLGFAAMAYTVLGQVNNNPTPDVIATVTNQQCSTFFLNEVFADICPLKGQAAPNDTIFGYTLSVCDSHCRCTHGAQYGQCIDRPKDAYRGALVALTNQMCKCYYSPPPPGIPTNNNLLDATSISPFSLFGYSYCMAWELTPFSMRMLPVCQLTSNNATSGDCNTDCACTHGYDYGVCDTWCSCKYKDGTQLKNGK